MTITNTTDIDTAAQLADAVAGFANELAIVNRWLEDGGPAPFETESEDDGFVYWLNGLLSWDYFTNRSGDIVSHELLATCGGPNIWAEVWESGHAKVLGAWGSDRIEQTVYVPALIENLNELA